MSTARRVLARFLRADLSPPLGYPGGPCHVVDRIEHDIRSPRLRDELVHEVENNDKVSNPDAAKIYHLEQERGVGIAKRMLISPHAQYRMDLRGITVPLLRVALASFSKLYFSLKSQHGPQFVSMDRELRSGKPYTWTDPKLGLTVAFTPYGSDAVTIVTTFWEGEQDPRARPGECGTPKQASESAAEFSQEFFARHPKLRKYGAGLKVLDKTGGSGSHPEARQHGREVHLYPKFWGLDAKSRDFVFAHEIGHAVLSDFGLSKMVDALAAVGVDAWDAGALPFGQFNMDEAFADCFASYMVDGDTQRRYPAWAKVIEQAAK